MADRWDSLRSKFQGKNIDLDAEFEKFLNESLSDESLASPRHKANPVRGKSSKNKGSSLPWWAEEDEDEDKKREATRKSWIKQKPPKPDSEKEDLPKIPDVEESQPTITGVTEDSRHGDSIAVSMSKDSLDEGARKSLQQEKLSPQIDDDITESSVYEEEKDVPTYSDEILTSIDSTSPMSPSRVKTPDQPPPGLDTLEEQEDKERFFKQEGADSQFDYENKLNDLTSSDTPHRDDKLQATGVEVGDSIFNISGDHQEVRSEITTSNNDNDEYSDDFEEAYKEKKDRDIEAGESLAGNPTKNVIDEMAKPSLLSKVSLMDSLDSTLDRNKPLPKQQPFPRQQQSERQTMEKSARRLRASDTGNLGDMQGGTTDTIAELQAALRQVQMDNTDRSGLDSGVQPEDDTQDNQLVVKKTPTGDTESRGFSLRPPVIASNASIANELKPADSAGFTITSDGMNSASIPVDCRGFSLQPSSQQPQPALAVDSRGIPLKSRVVPLNGTTDLEDSRGFDLKPVADLLTIIDQEVGQRGKDIEEDDDDEEEDTPPPDSLRSIKEKVRARKSVDTSKRSSSKKTLPGKKTESPVRARGSGKVTKKGLKKSKEQWQPSLSSPPSWSPTPSTRKSKATESKIPTLKSKSMKSRKDEDKAIVKSVESFANYLKHLVRPDEENSQSPPTPRWSDDEPIKSRSSVRITSTEDRLERISREKRLQSEIENWQEAWKEERRRNDKLIADMAARERELTRKEENLRMAYEEQIHELKQEMYSLQARLKEEQENNDSRKRVASGGSLKGISEEEKKKLEKEIHEQEKLMQGYQQENERLYKELKQIQAKAKSTEGRMFAENQKLATEVANLKEKLDQKAGQLHYSAPGSATLGADRINYLQDQLGSYKKRETKLDQEIDQLRSVNTTLEQRMRNLERERDNAVERANQALGTSTQERSELKIRYENDIERLNRKLKWYAENQEMLDRDIVKMKMRDQEIKELKDTLDRLRAQQSKAATEKRERTNERTADARRIRDLERQVREMEEIIKRRYPNSLPALIFAAASAPGLAQPVVDESPKKQSPSYVFLEQQVKKLEHQLEDRDEEASRVLRALEQKYNAMKLDYEERIKHLEQNLERANEKPRREHPHTTALALENELAAVREDDRRRISELENEVAVLQDALSRASMVQAHVKSKKNRKSDGKKFEGDAELLQRLQTSEKQLQEKEKDLTELRQTCLKLQQERETMLASPQRPSPHTPPRQAELERQNTALKQRLSDITLTMDQDRVRYQASLAEAERNARQSRDDAADQIEKLKAQHQREMNQIKGEFAVRLSTSVVTELKSKIASQEIVIQKLRDRVIMDTRNSEEFSAAKVREQALQQQLANLQNELRQAKENFTPEMRHFDSLQSKINAMEQRFNQRESDLERIINNAQIKSRMEKDESDSQWKLIIKKKNQEIERFREELDAILEALRELKRQGVVIPVVGNRY